MAWSFTSISYPVEVVYTQSVGFDADTALVRCNPQGTNLPAQGTLSMTWGATTITLPNCVVDVASVRLTPDGRYVLLNVKDRRERWKNAAPISGEYNTLRVGERTNSKTLRELGEILLDALGETSADVSALPTNVYPPVSWQCEPVIEAAKTLLEGYGYSVVLGFDAEAVKVVQIGTGAALPSTYQFVGSDAVDPKLIPRYVRSCFRESAWQLRLKLEPVGRESDGTWKHIDSLTYKPAAGWEKVPPHTLPAVKDTLTEANYLEANGYIRRAYRVSGFADDTWDVPGGAVTLSGLTDILPLQNRLLITEDVRDDESYRPFRVYGKYQKEPDEETQPVTPAGVTTAIGDEVVGRRAWMDGENGLLIFEEPIFYASGADWKAADLWLEATVQIRDQTTFAWEHYEKDIEVEPTGVGYHTVRHDQRAEKIIEYDSSHNVTGSTDNQTDLDALATAWATVVLGSYASTSSQHRAYAVPVLTLRCDGAITQIQHILTCGEHGHAVNRTVASRNSEFDKGIPSRAQRLAHGRALESAPALTIERRKAIAERDAND